MAECEQLAADALVTLSRILPWPAGAPAPGTQPEAAADRDRGGGRRLPSDDGPAPDASQGWWPAAPGAEHRLTACGQGQPGSGDRPPASEVVELSSEDEQLLTEDEEFEIAIGSRAAAKDEEVDQQAQEGIEEGQQHGRAE